MRKMSTKVILGAQWGDEGKGKILDTLAEEADITVRYHGGANAGHSFGDYVLHMLPAGIVHRNTMNILGSNVVVDLANLVEEIDLASQYGAGVMLDPDAYIVTPLHKMLDGAREDASLETGQAIGTTRRGIGPAYEDVASRRGIKLRDLESIETITSALITRGFYEERQALLKHYGYHDVPSIKKIAEEIFSYSKKITPLLGDTRQFIARAQKENKKILFEGAHGIMLDILQGTVPYVTSSNCVSGAVATTFGIYHPDRVYGVAKGYTTRVGAGPFPTKLEDEVGEMIRQQGNEYGSTTGRPRDCGWLDLVALRYAVRMGGITHLILTKLDVLTGFEKVKACIMYEIGNMEINDIKTLTTDLMFSVSPIYQVFDGWDTDLSQCQNISDLPMSLLRYVQYIAEFVGVPVAGISTGPNKENFITFEEL